MIVLLGLQLLLGIGSFMSRFTSVWIPGGQLTMLLLPVSHRLVGSLILAAAVVAAVRVLAPAALVSAPARPAPHLRLVRG
jgi:hypothetical protein